MNLLLYNEALKKISLARENIKTKQNKTESEILTEKKKKEQKGGWRGKRGPESGKPFMASLGQ